MIERRVAEARAKAGPLAQCLLALAAPVDESNEQQAIDRQAGAFVLAETIQAWRQSMTKR
jgi:hypothetical protein